jgi:hypothetical protein
LGGLGPVGGALGGGSGGGGGQWGEMTQALYAHMNNKTIKKIVFSLVYFRESGTTCPVFFNRHEYPLKLKKTDLQYHIKKKKELGYSRCP